MIQLARQQIYDFLQRHHLMALSTVCAYGLPHSAIVEYYLGPDFTLYFGTTKHSRKFQHLTTDQAEVVPVSVVIGSYEELTLQFEGTCELFHEPLLIEAIRDHVLTRAQDHYAMARIDDFAYFKITPSWIKYSDVSSLPWKVWEIDFTHQKPQDDICVELHLR